MAGELIQYQTEDGVTPVEQHFVDAVGKVKQIEAAKPKTTRMDKGHRA